MSQHTKASLACFSKLLKIPHWASSEGLRTVSSSLSLSSSSISLMLMLCLADVLRIWHETLRGTYLCWFVVPQNLIPDGFILWAWEEHHGSKKCIREEMFTSLWTRSKECDKRLRGYTSTTCPQLPTSPARPYVLMCLQHPQIAAQHEPMGPSIFNGNGCNSKLIRPSSAF